MDEIKQKARELLAAEYEAEGWMTEAGACRRGSLDHADRFALSAINKLIEQGEEDDHVITELGRLLASIAVILKGPEPAGTAWSYHDLPGMVNRLKAERDSAPSLEQALTQQRGELPSAKTFASAVWRDWMTNEQAGKLGAELHACLGAHVATTPQPSADAVRAIGWLNSDGSSYLPTGKRARMIEAGKREEASVGEVTFGKIAEDHRIALYAAPPSVACLVTAWRDRINVDPEDPYEHGESDALMSCADELESLLSGGSHA